MFEPETLLLTFKAKQWSFVWGECVTWHALLWWQSYCAVKYVVLFTYFRRCFTVTFFYSLNQSVEYIHYVNFFYSDDCFSLHLSASELEEEDDEWVPDLPGRYSVIINWLYHNCAIFLVWYIYFSRIKSIIIFVFMCSSPTRCQSSKTSSTLCSFTWV